MMDVRLYLAQRLSALIMVPLVLGHLALMIWAIQGGLSAADILARTQGSLAWFFYYQIFALAVSVHAAIGVRTVAYEWLRVPQGVLTPLSLVVFAGLFWTGWRAVWAVTLG